MKRAGRPVHRSRRLTAALRPPYEAPIMITLRGLEGVAGVSMVVV